MTACDVRISDWSSDVLLFRSRILRRVGEHAGHAIVGLGAAAYERQRLAQRVRGSEQLSRFAFGEDDRTDLVERAFPVTKNEREFQDSEQIAVHEVDIFRRGDRKSTRLNSSH